MSGPNAFFVSDSLAELFGEELPADHAYVEIGGVKGLLLSYSSTNRSLAFTLNQSYNPFEIIDVQKVKASIVFPKGIARTLEYDGPSYKIEQVNGAYTITIGDDNE